MAAEPELTTTGPAVPQNFDENAEEQEPAGAAVDDTWMAEHLRHMAQREHEFLAWQQGTVTSARHRSPSSRVQASPSLKNLRSVRLGPPRGGMVLL